MRTTLFTLAAVLLLPVCAQAHLPAWNLVQSAGEYDVSLSLSDPSPGEENLVSIALLRREPTVMFEDFDDAVLRIQKGDEVLREETLRQEAFGRAWTKIVFPDNGMYTAAILVRRDGRRLIAQTEYTFRIGQPTTVPWPLVGLLCGACLIATVVVRWAAGRT